jgi:hypothetical protein
MSLPRPDSTGDQRASERWVTLEDAATALHLSQQALWQRLQELQVDVRRIELGGRQVSGLSGADLARLGAPASGERAVARTPRGSNGARAARAEPAIAPRGEDAENEPPSLWQKLREFETQRDQLGFELHIVRTQLADALARAQQVEEAQRALHGEIERARADLEAARAEIEARRVQSDRLAAERIDAQSARDAAQQRLAATERRLAKLIEVESARERYCDRLEQRLRSLGAA